MAVRRRVWLNSPMHNYTDKIKYKLSQTEIDQYTIYSEENTHWNHGDFVNSSCTTKTSVPLISNQPNYMIIYNGNVIESRWYVNGFNFISGEPTDNYSKYIAYLLRDVIVDYPMHSALFKCKRGVLPRNQWSPVLVQPEGLAVNAVKKDQKVIESWDKDAQWLTIFYDVTASEGNRTISWTSTPDYNFPFGAMQTDYTSRGFTLSSSGGDNNLTRSWSAFTTRMTVEMRVSVNRSGSGQFDLTISPTGISVSNFGNYTVLNASSEQPAFVAGITARANSINIASMRSTANSQVNFNNTAAYSQVRNLYDGQVIQNDANYQRVQYTTSNSTFGPISNSSVNTSFQSAFGTSWAYRPSNWSGDVTFTVNSYGSQNTSGTTSSFTTSFASVPSVGSMILPTWSQLDEIYVGCLTIPFGVGVSILHNGTSYQLDDTTIKNIITNGRTNSTTAIYDIQILPYCPSGRMNSLNNNNPASNVISTSGLATTGNMEVIPMLTSANVAMYYAFTCTQSSMDYRFPVNVSEWFGTDLKMDSITKKLRLVAHNHKSQFEFNPVLNNGFQWLSFSYTIRPFNTIFRICPVFNTGSLYGGNFQDSRGLVYEGGSSLAAVTSAWTNYVMNNSTYQSSFDREVKNLEVSQSLSRAQETLNYDTVYANSQTAIKASTSKAIASSVLSTLGGAAAGFMTGGPVGAVVGGVGTSLGSGINAAISINTQQEIADRNLEAAKISQGFNDAQRSEGLAYKADMFTLNLQAIKASPGSISTTGEYSGAIYSTKAYLEFYDCTDEEKEWLENYLSLNGMKVGRFGVVSQFVTSARSYVEGTVVFAEGLTPVISNAINAEFNAGIYIQGGLFDE